MRFFLLLLFAVGTAAAQTSYDVTVDLKNVVNDRVRVEIRLPAVDADTATIVFPVVTPGTYEQQDWWRYVSNFAAFDAKGKPLPVHRSADSQFVVSQARRLHRVTYLLDDSFDAPDDGRPSVFEPSGTSFEADTIMQLNHCGIVGFVDGMQRLPFHLTVIKPALLTGASALRIERLSDTVDRYHAETYDMLNDSPVLYAIADTTSFTVGGTQVFVACAHKSQHDHAMRVKPQLDSVCTAIAAFLGTMPVDRYAFLMYVWNMDTTSTAVRKGGFGALEHSFSSLYFMHPGMMSNVKDIAAHEFLHILMPLNLHSEEIETFNFRTPNMSRHLWLYEGLTEYFAHLSLVRYGLTTPGRFMTGEVTNSIRQSGSIPGDFSFTEFSRRVLEEPYQSMYPLVYTYGMVNGLLIDIMMREATNGAEGALDLAGNLMKKYGRSRPFVDTLLFDEIDAVAPPTVAAYCRRYIGGNERIPIKNVLAKIGWSYDSVRVIDGWTFGVQGSMKFPDGVPAYVLAPTDSLNPLGIKEGDVLVSIDGTPIMEAWRTLRSALLAPPDERSVTIVVRRGAEEVTCKATSYMGKITQQHVLTDLDGQGDVTEVQRALRAQVFGR
jgi:predicted metalloprotease with PDZ domain